MRREGGGGEGWRKVSVHKTQIYVEETVYYPYYKYKANG